MTQTDPPSGPVPSPEGELIGLVRQSRTPSMSVRAAARLAGISETHWRHVEAGYESKGGMKIPVGVSAKTAARMAWAVGIGPERLAEVRPQAARILAEILRSEGPCVTALTVKQQLRAIGDAIVEDETDPNHDDGSEAESGSA